MPFGTMSKELGSPIPEFPLNGEMQRFKDEKGKYPFWAIGREWEYKGNTYSLIKYGDWRSGSVHTWKSYNPKDHDKNFIKQAGKKLDEIIAIEKYERQKKNDACIDKWKPIFKNAENSETVHEYLAQKQIDSNHIAKINDSTLLIPAYKEKGFIGLQQIFLSAETAKYVKYFSAGLELKGSFCPLGKIKDAKYIYVTEGYATACTVYETTEVPTICAWNCNNLRDAILSLRQINPKCRIIIAADSDPSGIGMKKALGCKYRFSNIIIKKPEFKHFDSNCTDFNDLLVTESTEIVKEQLVFDDSQFTEIILLGHDDKKYYYFNNQSMELKILSTNEHNELNFLSLADNKYWGERYKFRKDKEGNFTGYADFKAVAESLFIEQRQKGFFNFQNVRGYGTWIDEGRTVVNLGDKQIVDGKYIENFETKYLYTSNYPMPIDLENPLTDGECRKIINVFKQLNYKNKGDYIYVLGFITLAQIFNAIDWRFQLWLTGPAGSGKTEIAKMMAQLTFDSELYQSVTAAGIRQFLKSNAMPMIIDEAEPNCHETRKRMDGVIELIRQCSSRTNTKMLRGTAGGSVQEFNINSLFCLASIQTYLPTSADISRFFVIEMNTNENEDPRKWNKIQKDFKEIKNYSVRLFSRMVKMLPVLKENIDIIKGLLAESELIKTPRQCDQISTAMASYFALESSNYICDDDIPRLLEIAKELNLSHSEYEIDNDIDESETCLDTILQLQVKSSGELKNIGMLIEEIKDKTVNAALNKDLAFYGIKYIANKGLLFIAAKNVQLKKELKDTMYQDYSKLLKRHAGFEKYTACRLEGGSTKGVYLKIDNILDL